MARRSEFERGQRLTSKSGALLLRAAGLVLAPALAQRWDRLAAHLLAANRARTAAERSRRLLVPSAHVAKHAIELFGITCTC
eukprot:15446327-Alexandrium_andersonii.AAC.1